MIFKEDVNMIEGELVITVSCKYRPHAFAKKEIYPESRIQNLIPTHLSGRLEKIESPTKIVSNIKREKYINIGVWRYAIIKEKVEKKPSRPRRTKKTNLTSGKDSVTMKRNNQLEKGNTIEQDRRNPTN